MSQSLYVGILNEIASWPKAPSAIFLNMDGEPLQDPLFLGRLRGLREHDFGALVELQTNAHFLSEAFSRAILETGIGRLVVGFDGASKAVYESHRVRCSYDRALANLRRFAALRDQMNAPTQIAIQYVRTTKNDHEVLDCYQMFSEFLDAGKDVFQDNLSKDWGDSEYNRDLYYMPKRRSSGGAGQCQLFDSQLIIHSDGKIAACCWDYNLVVSNGGFGVAGESRLLDLWNGERRAQAGVAIADPAKRPAKCQTCIFSDEMATLPLNGAKLSEPSLAEASPFGYSYRFPAH